MQQLSVLLPNYRQDDCGWTTWACTHVDGGLRSLSCPRLDTKSYVRPRLLVANLGLAGAQRRAEQSRRWRQDGLGRRRAIAEPMNAAGLHCSVVAIRSMSPSLREQTNPVKLVVSGVVSGPGTPWILAHPYLNRCRSVFVFSDTRYRLLSTDFSG